MNALKISLCALVSLFLLVTTFYIINPFGQEKTVEAALSAGEAMPAVTGEMTSVGTPAATLPSAPAVVQKNLSLAAAAQPAVQKKKNKIPKERRIKEALELEELRTKDLSLGYVPRERLVTALEETRRRQLELQASGFYDSRGPNNIVNGRWRERGPNNVGGRTRALLVDLNDPERKTIYAGAASGGLWRTRDVTDPNIQWEAIDEFWASLAIGALAQDPNDPQYIYAGTGEYTDVRGFGIMRSSDGGNNWSLLTGTNNSSFSTTQAIAVNPVNGDVYAATNNGLFRSQNHGDTWTNVLSGFKHDVEVTIEGVVYSGGNSVFYRSSTGNFGDFQTLNGKPGFPGGLQRIEATVCTNQPETLYVVGAISGGRGSAVYKSTNGGESWTQKDQPGGDGGGNFARDQAWYDLDLVCSPVDPDNIYLGGIDLYHSTNGGSSFTRVSSWFGGPPQYVHADQHVMVFEPGNNDVAYFGNDGGVWRTADADSQIPDYQERNTEGYNVTQFYAGAMHPGFLSGYFLAGAQDNGSNQLNDPGISAAREVVGGDGFLCFIDQTEPNIQFASLYFGDFYLSTDGGNSFSGGVNTVAGFLTPADYDDNANILYAHTDSINGFCRFSVNTGNAEFVQVTNASLQYNTSNVYVDPNIANRIYIGTYNGQLYRANNAQTGLTMSFTQIGNLGGSISGIAVEKGNPDHILVTLSNYGSTNSIMESVNGGLNWTSCDNASLPDMPVRWCLFNPNNADQALIATEAGVWVTDNLNGSATQWIPPSPTRGIPLVRTDMLQIRESDKVVMAATYGRGVWTTGALSDPYPVAAFEQVSYTGTEVLFSGDQSIGDDSYFWNLGDGTTSSDINITHGYPNIGTYPITFTLNGDVTQNGTIKILPDLPLPYGVEEGVDAGGFDGFDEQFGIGKYGGSVFEKGNATLPGKSGVHSGTSAIVLGLEEQYYQPNTHAVLYLSNFDFSDPGIYEFSFWGKWSIQPGNDGFIVEYSEDKGLTWKQLGGESDDWYTFTVPQGFISAFNTGTPIFTSSTSSQWKQKKVNVSQFAGKPNIAFRVVFKSEGSGNFSGVALDDFKITKFVGELATKVTEFTGAFTGSPATAITLNWTTYPEYNCKQFHVERSENGRDFAEVEEGSPVFATGINSSVEQYYEFDHYGVAKLYYYRLHVINENPTIPYAYDFYTPVIVIRQLIEGVGINRVFPSPFTDQLEITFNDLVNGPVTFEMFDAAGRLALQETHEINGVYFNLRMPPGMAQGAYLFRITIGDGDSETVKVIRGE
jgi:hypothetical protein